MVRIDEKQEMKERKCDKVIYVCFFPFVRSFGVKGRANYDGNRNKHHTEK